MNQNQLYPLKTTMSVIADAWDDVAAVFRMTCHMD